MTGQSSLTVPKLNLVDSSYAYIIYPSTVKFILFAVFSHICRSSSFGVCFIELDDVCDYDKPSKCNIRLKLHGSPTA